MSVVHLGDCRDVMRQLIADGVKVQMCVTSPPYYGLRDYGVQGQLGLERSLGEFITNMVDVFDLVHTMLADNGTLWLNMGDTYNNKPGPNSHSGLIATRTASQLGQFRSPPRDSQLKVKDLMGVPWRLAFALQDAGWYLRQDIIWHKPNPMPESVRDRCTKAHEYIFLMSKSPRYQYNSDAISEFSEFQPGDRDDRVRGDFAGKNTDPGKEGFRAIRERRNKRSVWTVASEPYSGAHFATFPTALIEPCVLAGSRPGDTVLDPFFGSGTTGQVCNNLGREYIGIELNPEYKALQDERCAQPGLQL